ncbi:MAG: cation:proton antiporter [Candidatus Latescibacterota bacterium]
MQTGFLQDILIVFASAVVVLLACHGLRIPTIIGFLLTGALIGPQGLGLVGAAGDVEAMAEVGVVALLFTIGLEFSLRSLLRIRRQVLQGGALQVLLTVAAVWWLSLHLGLESRQALFAGFLVSLSSTAVVLRLLQERTTVESPAGRLTLAVLIFQDVAVVPMMLFAPAVAGQTHEPLGALLALGVKAVVLIGLVVAGAHWAVPYLLFHVARTRSRELFLFAVLGLALGVAYLTWVAGLSLALGAFLAGLILSESEYGQQALGNVQPFRDLFTSLFFVSVGMLLDLGAVAREPVAIAGLALAVLALKALLAAGAGVALGYPLATSVVAGLGLAQVGEFAFVLARVGLDLEVLPRPLYEQFLAISVLTLLVTPLAVAAAPRLAALAASLPWPQRLEAGYASLEESLRPDQLPGDHLIISGFGVSGRNVAHAARAAGIPYLVIELNPETVRRERGRGEPIAFGDASQAAVLQHAGVGQARILVSTIPDPAAGRLTVSVARQLNPRLHIIARTRFVQEVQPLHGLGADEVIPEEFETSVSIFARVLARYLVPRDQIERLAAQVRADGYRMLRDPAAGAAALARNPEETASP